jgi:predicted transcriptional regulator
MTKPSTSTLTRREREIMDILYRRSRATAAEVLEDMTDPPTYSAVRALLRILEDEGHIKHVQDGPRYVYLPAVARSDARKSALSHVVTTFFDGSVEQAVATLVESSRSKLSKEELERLAQLIEKARNDARCYRPCRASRCSDPRCRARRDAAPGARAGGTSSLDAGRRIHDRARASGRDGALACPAPAWRRIGSRYADARGDIGT